MVLTLGVTLWQPDKFIPGDRLTLTFFSLGGGKSALPVGVVLAGEEEPVEILHPATVYDFAGRGYIHFRYSKLILTFSNVNVTQEFNAPSTTDKGNQIFAGIWVRAGASRPQFGSPKDEQRYEELKKKYLPHHLPVLWKAAVEASDRLLRQLVIEQDQLLKKQNRTQDETTRLLEIALSMERAKYQMRQHNIEPTDWKPPK